ncbi:MAG: Fe-S cluster assembly protein SufD [Rhodospirillales bacterium]|nr:Fe-S cluster assembly protein SufD [Rhodospirillales bacterium]
MSITSASQAMLDRYEAVRETLPGQQIAWLADLREAAVRSFGETGLPTPKVEEWKYTNLRALDGFDFSEPPGDAGAAVDLPDAIGAGPRLVFVDGVFRDDLSRLGDFDGVRFTPLADRLEGGADLIQPRLGDLGQDQPLLALNGAFLEDGYVAEVAEKAEIAQPLEIVFADTGGDIPTARQPRNMIIAGAGSRVQIIETHLGAAPSQQFFNGATMITVAEGASVEHRRVQRQGTGSVHVNTVRARIDNGGIYDSFVLQQGAAVARDEVQVGLTAGGSVARLNGVYLGDGSQVLDNTTVVRHATENSTSEQLYKGALTGSARAVFQGNIRVEAGADGTDGRMTNKTLLLSDKAEIDTKPQLEILADDVKCSHGATAGELDGDALFYLRARGIPEAQARGMLVEAFLGEVIDGVEEEPIEPLLRDAVGNWLAHAQETEEV